MPSMPKVRASSGTMGTMLLPMFLSRASVDSMRTKAIVVEISRSPLSLSRASKIFRSGTINGSAVSLRTGM